MARLESIDDDGQLASVDALLENVDPAKVLAMQESERVLFAAGVPLTSPKPDPTTVKLFVQDDVPASDTLQVPRSAMKLPRVGWIYRRRRTPMQETNLYQQALARKIYQEGGHRRIRFDFG